MASPAIKSDAQLPSAPPARGTRQPDFMPSLFGLGYDTYQTRPSNVIFSFALHTLVIVLMVVITTWVIQHPKEINNNSRRLISALMCHPVLVDRREAVVAVVRATNWLPPKERCQNQLR